MPTINLTDPTSLAARLAAIDGTGLTNPLTCYETTTNAAIAGVKGDLAGVTDVFESELSTQTQWIALLYSLLLQLLGLTPTSLPTPNFLITPPVTLANTLLAASAATKAPPS
jgi:hypothetical protein